MRSASMSRRNRRTQKEWKVAMSGLARVWPPTSVSTRCGTAAKARVLVRLYRRAKALRFHGSANLCGAEANFRDHGLLRFRFLHPLCHAGLAGAILAQKIPGIDAQFVAIIPLKADGVFAHGLGLQRLGRSFEHGQRPGGWFGRLHGLSAALAPLFVAQRARAGVAQPFKAVAGVVAVLPLDVHARSRGQIHRDRLGISLLIGGHILSIAQGIALLGVVERPHRWDPTGLLPETVILSEGACPSRKTPASAALKRCSTPEGPAFHPVCPNPLASGKI